MNQISDEQKKPRKKNSKFIDENCIIKIKEKNLLYNKKVHEWMCACDTTKLCKNSNLIKRLLLY